MPLNFEEKKAVVAEVSDVATKAISAVVADNKGLSSNELTDLRAKARQAKVYLRVVKNTLAKRAIEDTDFACVSDVLTGPSVLAFGEDDPGAPARLFKAFVSDHEALEVKGLAVGGQFYAADKLKEIASLPTYEEALASLMMVMQGPITKFVRTTSETYASLVRVMNAVAEQKKAQA